MQSRNPVMEQITPVDARLLTLPEAARYLGCTVWAVRELIWRGDLSYTRFGKRFQVELRDLDVLIDREKRQDGPTQLQPRSSRARAFVVTSTPQGSNPTNACINADRAKGRKKKNPRGRLDLQAEISSEERCGP